VKILFLRSGGYFTDIYFPDRPMIAPPKSILYLAGLFKNNPEVECSLLDVLAEPDYKQIKKDMKNPPFYFGLDYQEIKNRVASIKPDVIAVTATANYYVHETIKLINFIKLTFPEVFIVLGGPDATNDYKVYFEKSRAIDIIVIGEGEIVFKNLVESLTKGKGWKDLKGIAYRDGQEIIRNPDESYIEQLDDYQCDYNIVDFNKYFRLNQEGFESRFTVKYKNSHKSIDIVTSRGCPHHCTFCCIRLHMGDKFRYHSVEHVIDEMNLLIEEHGIRNFHFEDDNLLANPERFKNILRSIIAKGWKITWDTPNGVRADLIDRELLELANQSGCTYLVFGVESGSKKVLDGIIDKKLGLDEVVRACKLCFEYQIDTLSFYIVGMPGETKQDLLKTYYFAFDMLKKYNSTPVFQLWRPYKNTPMERSIRETYNITEPVIYSLHKKYRIPYTLFYSKVYEDEEITLEFLSYYFKKYIKDVTKDAFKNWIMISRKKPLIFLLTLFKIVKIGTGSMFKPSAARYILQEYLTSKGLLPFTQLKKRKYRN
jgi:anaerobic magnesium-protoporphyrin IX monomethyl ester cyclase